MIEIDRNVSQQKFSVRMQDRSVHLARKLQKENDGLIEDEQEDLACAASFTTGKQQGMTRR